MSSFGQDFLKGFTATSSLRDYTHASKTFRTNAYELKPRFKFLFHVVFTLNYNEIPALKNAKIFNPENVYNLSLAVKTVELPKFSIDTTTLNQYNRKRVVQTKINYEPVSITFHDDGGDNIREMWYQYYSYYYKDPAQKYVNNAPTTNGSIGQTTGNQVPFDYNARDIYSQNRSVSDWGFIGENFMDGTSSASGKPPFFKDIQIYGFDQHKYARYILINPVITAYNHDTYNYSEGSGTMQNTMTIRYETVKYLSGALGKPDANVSWPDPAHYDTQPSPLARAGSTASVFGQGGLLSTGQGILADLESGSVAGLIGAAQKAGATYNTFKGKNLKAIVKSEAVSLGTGVIKDLGPAATRQVINKADGWVFPTATTQRQFNAALSNPVAGQVLSGGGGV
jgi:hypothetical protein